MRQVGIRFGTTGKAQVLADLDSIGRTGDAAFDRIARGARKAANDAGNAVAHAERQMAKLAAAMPGLNPARLDMAAGVRDQIGKSAESSASVFAASYAQMEARARALMLAIDPAAAAQDRFNREMAEARGLVSAGVLSLDQYVQKLRHEKAALDSVVVAHGRGTASTGSMRQALAGASYQVQDLATQISMGANPINAFVVQGGQLAGQFQSVEGRAGAVARFLMGPWGLALQVGLMAAAPLVAKLWEASKAADEAKKAADEHRKAVLDLADAQTKAILTAERKQALDVAQINLDLKAALAARQRVQSELALAQALAEQARPQNIFAGGPGGAQSLVAQQYAQRVGELEQQIKANDAEIARLQGGVNAGVARLVGMAADNAATPEGRIRAQYERERSALMRDPELQANPARLRSKVDELIRERDRELKAIQQSTQARKQDSETVTASAVAKMLREAIPGVQVTSTTGGKHVANSYHYRPGGQAIDFVPAGGMGSMTKDDVRRIFESRGIDVVELLGPGDKGHSDHFHVAWTKGKLSLDEFNDAAKRATERQRDLDALVQAFDPATAAAEDYRATLAKIAALNPPNADTLKANAWADYAGKRADTFQIDTVEGGRGAYEANDATERKLADDRAKAAEYAADYLADQSDRMALLERERQLIAANDNVRGVELEKLRIALDLRRRFPQIANDDVDAILRGIDAQSAMNDEIARTAAALDEVRLFGMDFAETVLSPDTWEDWGEGGKRVFAMVRNEFLKLALLNPIRNLLNGSSDAPTLGSLFTSVAGLFGGSSGLTPMRQTGEVRNILGLASGTEYWSGGAALLGEHGPEIASLPIGARVTPAAATRRMIESTAERAIKVEVMPNPYFDVRVTEIATPIAHQVGADAAVRGAAGGAQMAGTDASMRAARRLGRRW